jgi:indolepyruvate ferredoxin oxidoreductase
LTLSAYGKHLRDAIVDPFGFSDERRTERALIRDYRSMMRKMTACLDDKNYDLAVELAETPD